MEGKQNLVHNRSQEKGVVFPQETESALPVSFQESLVEAWVDVLASGNTIRWEHRGTGQQKIGLKIYRAWPHPSKRTRFLLQSVSPIRKLP